ncbi:hypothetical protein [Pseudohongiella sp. O18]|uniref:hypothetical protein n=1 Tax=Pseudohongiella sp. O18 TaxID=2904248 RepID=UPI001F425135|nr:hypothetical protein [Pseudohongiella sp. O18]
MQTDQLTALESATELHLSRPVFMYQITLRKGNHVVVVNTPAHLHSQASRQAVSQYPGYRVTGSTRRGQVEGQG